MFTIIEFAAITKNVLMDSITLEDSETEEHLLCSFKSDSGWDRPLKQPSTALFQGWLKKRGTIASFWRDRYFVLSTKYLHYYKHKDDPVPRGSIKIYGYVSISPVSPSRFDKEFVFQLKTQENSKRVHYLQAPSEEAMENWISCIRKQVIASRRVRSLSAPVSPNVSSDESSVGTDSCDGRSSQWEVDTFIGANGELEYKPSVSSRSFERIKPRHSRRPSLLDVFKVDEDAIRIPDMRSTTQRIVLYETKHRFYLLGFDESSKRCRFLKILRADPSKIQLETDDCDYSLTQVSEILDMVRGANENSGGLKKRLVAFGLVGFVKFLRGYYMIFITEREVVGDIGGHKIYSVGKTEMVSLRVPSSVSGVRVSRNLISKEAKYLSRFNLLDLTRDFYFSYTYDISRTLQHNMKNPSASTFSPNKIFVWNSFLLEEFRNSLGITEDPKTSPYLWDWNVHLVHGFFEQSKCSILGRCVDLFLISRRSRLFAGTRYLKRGINSDGCSANDVETEQIVFDRNKGSFMEGQYTSYVQMRASIPLFWTQESNAMVARPPIIIQRRDSIHEATKKHFEGIFRRYGTPCLALNLVQQTEVRHREAQIGSEFSNAVDYLNHFLPKEHAIDYFACDYKYVAKSKSQSVTDTLMVIAQWALQRTGVFHSHPRKDAQQRFPQDTVCLKPNLKCVETFLCKRTFLNIAHTQRGICRSNCVDSLDRTNAAQFCIGKCALGYQLYAMGLNLSMVLESDSPIVKILLEMYERMGDALAMQYGGSQMHRHMRRDHQMQTMAPVLFRNKVPQKPKEILVSLMRHYQNSFQDKEKQDAINLFLGNFVPSAEESPEFCHIWDTNSDFFLHNPVLQPQQLTVTSKSKNWWSAAIEAYEESIGGELSFTQRDVNYDCFFDDSLTSFDQLFQEGSYNRAKPTFIHARLKESITMFGQSLSTSRRLIPLLPPSSSFSSLTPLVVKNVFSRLRVSKPMDSPLSDEKLLFSEPEAPFTGLKAQSQYHPRLGYVFPQQTIEECVDILRTNKLNCSSVQKCLALPDFSIAKSTTKTSIFDAYLDILSIIEGFHEETGLDGKVSNFVQVEPLSQQDMTTFIKYCTT